MSKNEKNRYFSAKIEKSNVRRESLQLNKFIKVKNHLYLQIQMGFKMEDQDRKKIIIMLRWTAIIVTSYLILFGKGRMTDLYLSYLLIFVYLLSNVSLSF